MRCENCKYWTKSKTTSEFNSNTGECSKPKMFWEASKWVAEDEDFDPIRVLKEEFRDNGMFVQDGSDYSASLITQADFGCVKYESVINN